MRLPGATVVAACWLLLLPGAGPAAAEMAGVPETEELTFAILREGDRIGTHTYRFRPDGAALEVHYVTDIAVKLAFITAFRFEHAGHEAWRDGRLVSLTTRTNDDGDAHTVKAVANGNVVEVMADGVRRTADPAIMPASFWDPRTVERRQILNVVDGRLMTVAITDLGEETISAAGRSITARHYVMTGDFQRELWFDASGVMVRQRFIGEAGSEILFELE